MSDVHPKVYIHELALISNTNPSDTMGMNKGILAAVVVVVIIAAAGAAFMMGDSPDEEYDYNIRFLVQDGEFSKWCEGSGDTAVEAAENALRSADIDYVFNGNNVISIMDKSQESTDTEYIYWLQFYWDEAINDWNWSMSVGLGTIGPETEYYCFYYGGLDAKTFEPVSKPTLKP